MSALLKISSSYFHKLRNRQGVKFTHNFWPVISECVSKSVTYTCTEEVFESNFDFKIFRENSENKRRSRAQFHQNSTQQFKVIKKFLGVSGSVKFVNSAILVKTQWQFYDKIKVNTQVNIAYSTAYALQDANGFLYSKLTTKNIRAKSIQVAEQSLLLSLEFTT